MKKRPLTLISLNEMVPREMHNELIENPYGDGFAAWKLIPSQITESYLHGVEKQLKVKLPTHYKWFVQYKYFINIYTHNNAISFERITEDNKLNDIVASNLDSFFRSSILNNGYLAIASFYDYGCVILNCEEGDDKVYVSMFENLDRKFRYADNLLEILSLDPDYANHFIEMHNSTGWK
ncbi:SMI1/KNR4 family protein [Lewinella sp. IMCC34183]|uniref:SMI1/KNR4 family protein n=1 Tax=Lewinella sp. IMCC34183 TaxID=2248762 RepID=UPI0013003388|nr:SMI1/KNR4 family protein [Lewinella sp. IMCC34183]